MYNFEQPVFWLGAGDEQEEGVWRWISGEEFTVYDYDFWFNDYYQPPTEDFNCLGTDGVNYAD